MTCSRMAELLVLLVVAVGILPPAAMAGRTSVETSCGPGPDGMGSDVCDSRLTYTAAPGETNDVTVAVAWAGDEPTVLRDATATVAAGPGCTQLDAHGVRCPETSSAVVQLGDGDDRGAGSGELGILGGPGNDRLSSTEGGTLPGTSLAGGPGDDGLTGGGGPDSLDGGGGRDVLRGGAGNDRLDGDGAELAAGSDTIDGGPGTDTVSYVARRSRVSVDLAAGRAGGSGSESDAVTAIENADGGSGPTLLRGDDGPNRLVARSGPSMIEGRGGDDELTGSAQRDRIAGGDGDDELRGLGSGDVLSGGRGSDSLYPQTGSAGLTGAGTDRLDCGPGMDVTVPYRSVLVPRSCEVLALPGYALTRGRLRAGRRIAVRVERIRAEEGYACSGAFTLRTPDRRIRGRRRAGALLGVGRIRFPRREGAGRTASIRLNRRGRAANRRPGPLKAVLGLRTSTRCGAAGRPRGARYAFRVAL